MLTGRLASEHGVHTNNLDYSTIPHDQTFLSDLQGYRTIGVSANPWASSAFGFDDHFDQFVDISRSSVFAGGMDARNFDESKQGAARYIDFVRQCLDQKHPIRSLGNGLLYKLESSSRTWPIPKPFDDGARLVTKHSLRAISKTKEPFFLFTNFMDAHTPHHRTLQFGREAQSVPSDWSSFALDDQEINVRGNAPDRTDLRYFKRLYAASIMYLDRVVAEFIDDVRDRCERETVFVITADHGENLCTESDDGLLGHTGSLSEGLLHVPLLVVGSSRVNCNNDGLMSHVILPDLLLALSHEEPMTIDQKTIAAELIGIGLDTWDIEHGSPEYEYWNRKIRCAYRDDTKVVWDSLGDVHKYRFNRQRPNWQSELDGGPKEAVPDWATDLFKIPLEDAGEVGSQTTEGKLSSSVSSRLSDLGYI